VALKVTASALRDDYFLSGIACVRTIELQLYCGATCSGVRRFHFCQEILPCAIG
jgi:hypothetical protein